MKIKEYFKREEDHTEITMLDVPIVCQEECAEVIQSISKIFRFGIDQEHPVTGVTNREALTVEVGQLMFMLDELADFYNLSKAAIMFAYNDKANALKEWKEYAPK